MPKPDYDTTIARMAGNIAGQLAVDPILRGNTRDIAQVSLAIARAIVAEVRINIHDRRLRIRNTMTGEVSSIALDNDGDLHQPRLTLSGTYEFSIE